MASAGALERGIYRIARVVPDEEQSWQDYAIALLCFHLFGVLLAYAIFRLQAVLPFNPQRLGPLSPDLALNTAVSFATNTSWQSYAGESTLSYGAQMGAITVQSFLSGATGVAVAFALIRGIARRTAATIGNFWMDLTRVTLYLLLPLSILATLFLVWQGVPQTLDPTVSAAALDGAGQTIARGPIASQESIKLLSGDGGGYFNANSSHPFEDPTPLAGFVEMVLIFLMGAPLTNTFGRMVGDQRQGWVLFAAMAMLFVAGFATIYAAETHDNPTLHSAAYASQIGTPASANMEGKEVRFGAAQSSLFAEISTASSDGAVNSMHDSFMPMSASS